MIDRWRSLRQNLGTSFLRDPARVKRLMVGLSLLVFVLVIWAVLAFASLGLGITESVTVGGVAPRDVLAPFTITYTSDLLTGIRQEDAADAVFPVYDPPDPNVARQQIQLLQQILSFITDVRADGFATPAQRLGDLRAISSLTLDEPIIDTIASVDDATWQAISTEASTVLERVMRESIRENDLLGVIDGLAMQVSVRFNPVNANVVTALVEDMVRPNRMLNEVATESARQAAVDAVEPETRSFVRGQVVMRAGTSVSALDYEALDNLGLLVSTDRRVQLTARALLGALLAGVVTTLYFQRFHTRLLDKRGLLWVIEAIYLLGFVGFVVFNGTEFAITIYPAAVVPLVLTGLVSTPLGLASAGLNAMLYGLVANNSLEVAAVSLFGGIIGALLLKNVDRLNRYFYVGLVIALVNILVVVSFSLGQVSVDAAQTIQLIFFALLNGVVSASAALGVLYLVTVLFNYPTSLKLVELSQPNQPLLQRLLREAPGTYQHSLQVANLAEQAASAVGANAELVRVAALYHDVGKMLNPAFFVENQVDGNNPHDSLHDPHRSADIIIAHVPDGDRLARQYRLPVRVRDFIWEHHGTTQVGYFLNKAITTAADASTVERDLFTYPGPRPQSKETAILMLADTSESTVRARKPANKQEISSIVREVVESRIADGQLAESNLTLRDIETIRSVFVEMLQGVFHPRINYPANALSRLHTQETPSVLPAGTPDKLATGKLKPAADDVVDAVAISDDDAPLPEVPRLRRTSTVVQNVVEMPAPASVESENDADH
ncbi:MAG: HDIG domain-containing protein [Pleurocapsa minor GSE-CHR-MK-17-07R]|jgi:putative nucleotidyltransferase with HDIG domain|nr:HDIG domain-containing protein [Pleurocapsa minor GSE-CHR-MK 17-07R]